MTLNQYTQKQRINPWVANQAKRENTLYCKKQIMDYVDQNNIKFDFPYRLHFTWFRKNKRTDPDNICFAHKFILDALQEANYLKNDNWANIKGFIDDFKIDKDNPHIEIDFIKE